MIIIGIDPGNSTGMVMLRVGPHTAPEPIAYATHSEADVIRALTHFVRSNFISADHPEPCETIHVVVEKFVQREGINGKDLSPERINGKIAEWHQEHPYVFMYWQLPGERSRVTDTVLRNLQIHRTGHANRHINDASRHAVTHLMKMRHKPTMRKAHP